MTTSEMSLSWRCCDCGRLRLASEPIPSPSPCADCGGIAFDSVGPYGSASGRSPDESTVVTWPVVDRRKSSRGWCCNVSVRRTFSPHEAQWRNSLEATW